MKGTWGRVLNCEFSVGFIGEAERVQPNAGFSLSGNAALLPKLLTGLAKPNIGDQGKSLREVAVGELGSLDHQLRTYAFFTFTCQ